jgi:hypothetical protein
MEIWKTQRRHIYIHGFYMAIFVPRKIFGPKRDEVTGSFRKFHNEELHNLYSSPRIIRMIKSRRMRWTGNVALMGPKRHAYRILVEKPEQKTIRKTKT